MDLRYRFDDDTELHETIRDAVLSGLHIAIPVGVSEDSKDGHTVKLKALVKAVRRKPDGSKELVEMPPFSDVPIQFASGGGMTSTFPIKAGEEGIYLVSSRGFDAWHQQGGAQPAIDARRNSLSDGFFIPGVRSGKRKLQNYSTESAQMRSDDGKHVFDLHPKNGPSMAADGGKHMVSVSPTGGISIKTTTALAVDAAKGTTFKGATHFTDAVSSDKSFKAPTLTGQVGGGFTGIANGFVGALIGAGAVLLAMAAQTPADGVQRASYTLAKVIR
ncbi:hypothetical protein HNR01_001791 [Methylorubrum rhodesianum]|uniref:Gp138 family membrane-puncturing spike protein n=1 Tax=Methylorubrum rhodesianum TaxID=29427 RepID=UPI00160A4EF6|nr:Gp138 family membrane-puncturing spike protein [Methylorubrum rhodesianum]MBB5762171.1 hypothetical protein [Methylorubrum rhodesianum]